MPKPDLKIQGKELKEIDSSLLEYIGMLQSQHAEKLKELHESKFKLREATNQFYSETRNLIIDLLNVIDSFDLLIENLAGAVPKENKQGHKIIRNFAGIRKKIETVLKKNQVTPIENTSGEFIAGMHKVVASEGSDSVKEGSIIRVERKGYYWKNKVLRPTEVVVAEEN